MALSRRQFIAGSAALLQKRRTNLVMFMTDDHGPWATGMSGCAEMATPNVDRLAREGVRFTNAHACTPVSSPSRMTWLTGLLPCQHGVQDYLLPEDSFGSSSRQWLKGLPTWSEMLQGAGYRLAMTGKWHMGMDDTAQAGFSFWASVPGGGGPYKDATFVKNGERVKTSGFKEDRIGDFAIEFLESMKGRPEPFALLVPFYAPHTPYDYQPEEYRKPYDGAGFACFPNTPVNPHQNPSLLKLHGSEEAKRAYSALITAMDANVGRVMEQLTRMGAREATTVVFTADQGWNAGHHGVWGKGNGTVPFNLYDESTGVPLVWNHPGRLKADRIDEMVSSYDYLPTLTEWLGVKVPQDRRRVGRSYAPLLQGNRTWRRDSLYFEYSYMRGVRTRDQKLALRAGGQGNELYDLKTDPGESKNVYRQGTALERDLNQFFRGAGAPALEDWRTTTKQKLFLYTAPV